MNKTLHTFGCSYTYGSGLLDLKNKWDNPSKLSFPFLLAKELNCDLINHSNPGSSNQKIFRTFLSRLKNIRENDIVFVLWTFPDRLEYFTENCWSDLGYWEVSKKNDFHTEIEYYRNIMLLSENSHFNNILKTIDLMHCVSLYLQNKKIVYFFDFLFYMENHLNKENDEFFVNYKHESLLKSVNFLSKNNYLEYIRLDNRISDLDGFHPNEEAHKIYSEFLFKEINEKI